LIPIPVLPHVDDRAIAAVTQLCREQRGGILTATVNEQEVTSYV